MIILLGKILAFLIVFGILVFIHEFGHFFMGRLVGIRIEVFSFGFGKRLLGSKKAIRTTGSARSRSADMLSSSAKEPMREAGPSNRTISWPRRDGSGSWSWSWARC